MQVTSIYIPPLYFHFLTIMEREYIHLFHCTTIFEYGFLWSLLFREPYFFNLTLQLLWGFEHLVTLVSAHGHSLNRLCYLQQLHIHKCAFFATHSQGISHVDAS